MNTFRIAVVSDIHASADAVTDTYVHTEPPSSLSNEQPLSDLISFVRGKAELSVDLLLCPGDLTNRSDDRGKVYGWRKLNELAEAFGAKHLIATPGNHDLFTRDPSIDSAEILKNLTPSFPSRDEIRDAEFWRDGFTIHEEDIFRLVNLNSCYGFPVHPGVAATEQQVADYRSQLNRGSFSVRLEKSLSEALVGRSEKSVNILLCHHHPMEHQLRQHFKDSYGAMHRGGDLIALLEQAAHCGRWTVVHGHKHIPMLTAAGSSANSPIVLCAASLGGKLWHPVVSVTRNQFHIIEFATDAVVGLAYTRGVVDSYSWGFGAGWRSANDVSGLPGHSGFGMSVDPRELAARLADMVDAAEGEFLRFQELARAAPEIEYQTPQDSALLDQFLERRGKVVHRDRRGRVLEIAKDVSR